MAWNIRNNLLMSVADTLQADWQTAVGRSNGLAYVKKILVAERGGGVGTLTINVDGLSLLATRDFVADEILQLDFPGPRGARLQNLTMTENVGSFRVTVFLGEQSN